METLICFENPLHRDLYQELYPEHQETLTTFRDFVPELLKKPVQSLEARLEKARALPVFKDLENIPLWLSTLEELREVWILTPEHASHCFQALPDTRKNQALYSLMQIYLTSPLADDFTAAVWQLIGLWKEGSFTSKRSTEVIWVPDSPMSYLFGEIVKAAASSGVFAKTESRHLADWGTSPSSPAPFFHGEPLPSADRLASEVKNLLEQDPSLTLWIPLQVETPLRRYIELALAHHQVSFDSWPEISKAPRDNSQLSSQRANLRSRTDIPLGERLKLEKTLLQGELPASEPTAPKPKKQKAQVHLMPWIPLPNRTGHLSLSLCDASIWKMPEKDSFLTPWEREILFQAGFPLFRPSQVKQTQGHKLAEFAAQSGSAAKPFFALCEQELPDGPRVICEPRIEKLEVPAARFQADLQIKSLSATQLETYAQCPSKYFFSRLRLNPLREPEDAYALTLGLCLHHVLEHSFEATSPKVPAKETLLLAFDKAFQLNCPPHLNTELFKTAVQQGFLKAVSSVEEMENGLYTLFKDKTRIGFEVEFEIPLFGANFRGKIDRIDETREGALIVLDYKTGNVDFTPDHIRQGKNFQALLYWLAAELAYKKPIAAVLFYDLKQKEIRRGIGSEEYLSPEAKKSLTRGHTLSPEKRQLLKEVGLQEVERLATGIRNGNFEPTPSTTTCRYCEAVLVCRKGLEYV